VMTSRVCDISEGNGRSAVAAATDAFVDDVVVARTLNKIKKSCG